MKEDNTKEIKYAGIILSFLKSANVYERMCFLILDNNVITVNLM